MLVLEDVMTNADLHVAQVTVKFTTELVQKKGFCLQPHKPF